MIKERSTVVEDGEQRSTRAVGAVGGATDGNMVVEVAGAWAGAKVDSFTALPTQPNAPGTLSRARHTPSITPTLGTSTSSAQRGTTGRGATGRRGTSNAEEAVNAPQHNTKTALLKKK